MLLQLDLVQPGGLVDVLHGWAIVSKYLLLALGWRSSPSEWCSWSSCTCCPHLCLTAHPGPRRPAWCLIDKVNYCNWYWEIKSKTKTLRQKIGPIMPSHIYALTWLWTNSRMCFHISLWILIHSSSSSLYIRLNF